MWERLQISEEEQFATSKIPFLVEFFKTTVSSLMLFSIYACSVSFAGSVGYLPCVCIPCGFLFACS
jgi:hypothetical protein